MDQSSGKPPYPATPPLSRLWSGLSAPSKRLIIGGGILLLGMATAVVIMMAGLRQVTQSTVRENLSKLGIAIAEQTARSIQAVDVSVSDLQKTIAAAGITTPEDFRTKLRTLQIQAILRQKDEILPQANAFTLVGADGILVNFSREWPVPVVDLSDRDYFRYFRDHNDPAAFITKPVENRGNGGWTAYVVRRVNGPSGQFIGLVLGAIDLAYFQNFYKALTSGGDTTVSMLSRDGTVLVNYPPFAAIGVVLPASAPWYAYVARGVPATYTAPGVLAVGERVVSIHPLTDYPLVLSVSVSEWASLADWRKAAALAAIGTCCAMLGMILLLRALMLQLLRLEHSESSLASQNLRLEHAGQEMQVQAESLRASEEHLAENAQALQTTLGHMNQGIMMVTGDHKVAVFNQRVLHLLELPRELMASAPLLSEVIAYQRAHHEFERSGDLPLIQSTGLSNAAFTYERQRPNGQILEIESIPLSSGGMVQTFTDITDRRISEEKLRYFAHHDDLTKLVNRVVFRERLRHAIELADRTNRSIAVLYLDLDRFKQVNDTMGHSAGDKLLVEAAKRLRDTARDIDTVARMGGDEFAIIQPLIDNADAAAALAERVTRLLNRPFTIDGITCSVGVSVGIALYPKHGANSGDLLRNADTALYRAKADGRNLYRVFEPAMDVRQQHMFELERDLRKAVELRQFELDYQPIVHSDTRLASHCEALLRWRHPVRGVVSPGEFIELAESSRLIIPIGLWVLETACTEAMHWPDHVAVAVNLSPAQFNHDGLGEAIRAILERTGFAPHRLVLEITEGLLLEETSGVMATMLEMRHLGVQFSLDDFGTAHAGLSYLQRFPFDSIKIDKSFVQNTTDRKGAQAIVKGVLGIATALNLRVIAEGVETEEQMAKLKSINCRYVQGYLTGRPMPSAAIRTFLARTS